MQPKTEHIYLDNQSTTPIDARVLEEMLPYLTGVFGNPSSDNGLGAKAKKAVSRARAQVAELVGAMADEIYFTSGATEAINWAIRGVVEKSDGTRKHIVTTAIEHSAVLKTVKFIETFMGFQVTIVPPGSDGIVPAAEIAAAISPQTLLVIMQHANNEIGTIQPVAEVGAICREKNVLFLVDAAQSMGKIPCNVAEMGIDLLAASGHKLYAPKGCGFLYIREAVKGQVNPLLYGGGQEGQLRSGTLNVPYIVGLGKACAIAREEMKEEAKRVLKLRELFISIIHKKIPDMIINGHLLKRLPGNINFSVPGVSSDILLKNAGNISISKGSACNAEKKEQSHVLRAITANDCILNGAVPKQIPIVLATGYLPPPVHSQNQKKNQPC